MAKKRKNSDNIPQINFKDLLFDNSTSVTELEAFIIIVLSVYGEIRGKTQIYKLIERVVGKNKILKNLVVTNAVLKNSVDHLCTQKILCVKSGIYTVAPHHSKGVTKKVVKHTELEAILYKALVEDFASRWRFPVQIIRYCILSKRTHFGSQDLASNFFSHSITSILLDLVHEDGDMSVLDYEYFESIDPSFARSVMRSLPQYLGYSDLIVKGTVDWFLTLKSEVQYRAFYSVLSYLCLYGTPLQIDQVVSHHMKAVKPDYSNFVHIGFVADMLRGDFVNARKRADLFKDVWADINNSKRKEMPFVLAGFYAILLYFSNKASDKKSALTYLRGSIKDFNYYDLEDSPGVEFIELLLNYFLQKDSGKKISLEDVLSHPDLGRVWLNTISAWEGLPMKYNFFDDEFFTVNTRLNIEIRACGFYPSSEDDKSSVKALFNLCEQSQIKPLVDFIKPLPKWEQLLNSFEEVANVKSKNSKEVNERLVWLVSFENQEIQPYYQKLQKAGWSKGRNIALRTISSKIPTYASSTDIQIINNLKRVDGWYGVEYVWDFSKCLPHFVNHPLLFSFAQPMEPMVLQEEEVGLVVKEKNDKITIALTEKIDDRVIKEAKNRYKYLVWDTGVYHTATMMKNQGVKVLEFPLDVKDRVEGALTSFSKRVSVRGDFDDPNLIKKKAKADLFVRLQQQGDNLNISALIKPLPKDNLTFIPGVGNAQIISRIAGGDRVQLTRSLKNEVKALNELKTSIPSLVAMEEHELALDDELEMLEFLSDMREFAPKVALEWPKGERFRVGKVASMSDFNVNVKSNTDWFEVNANMDIDGDKLWSMKQLMEASANGSKAFIKLDDNTYIKLHKQLQKRLAQLSAIGQTKKDGIQVHKLGADSLSSFVDEAGKTRTDKAWKDTLKLKDELRQFVPEMPGNLQAQLRPYQIDGYNWLSRLHALGAGACLADDMGLGKTLQAIAVITKQCTNGASLVIAPSSVCPNWHREIQHFSPTLRTHSLGSKDREQTIEQLTDFDVLIVSYGLIQSNPELLATKEWNIVVLDEAHAIKNAQSIRSKAAMKLNAQFKIAMTGTPIQNHLGEMWNLFQFINPGFLGSYDNFNARFNNGDTPKEVEAKRKALNRYISPFILRRNKRDVLDDLPEKTEITLTIEQSQDEKALYEALRQTAVTEIEEHGGDNAAMKILAQISKLRMASCNPRLVDGGTNIASSKMDALSELVDNLLGADHKALIFSQFTKHLALIKEMLDAKGIGYQYLDGSCSMKSREESIKQFQSGKSDIFLISLKAGGVGLNLTAADYVIHMDPWWNPAIEDQASDRAHRIGQQRPVTVYRLVSEGTIEEKIVKLHHTKRDLADKLLAETDKSAKITSAELFSLMK